MSCRPHGKVREACRLDLHPRGQVTRPRSPPTTRQGCSSTGNRPALPHSLLLGLGTVTEEEESSG